MRKNKILCMLTLMIAQAVSLAPAAEDDHPTYTDPAKAGSDFKVQGEYLGRTRGDGDGAETWGAQVIALGDGDFRLMGYKGGLPGEGWKRGDENAAADGERRGESVVFAGDDWTATIKGDVMAIHVSGEHRGDLKKMHRKSKTLGAKPPQGVIVLFAGDSVENWVRGKLVDDRHLLADTESKQSFGDHHLHLEFRTPFKPHARGQARGNSGVYLQSRYELQVLDSFGLDGKNNECGGFYQIREPDVNMCYPPLSWQTYDIDFVAARYDDQGKKTAPARVTVRHNGVVIHDGITLPNGTPGKDPEGPGPAPLYLQGHGNPVVYRNIWVVAK